MTKKILASKEELIVAEDFRSNMYHDVQEVKLKYTLIEEWVSNEIERN